MQKTLSFTCTIGNAHLLKYDFGTFCNLMTSYGLDNKEARLISLNFSFSVAILNRYKINF